QGQVSAGVGGTGLCVTGAITGAEYALVPFNGAPATDAAFDVAVTGTAAAGALTSLIATSAPSLDLTSEALGGGPASYPRTGTFEARLRTTERTALPGLMPGARTWMRTRSTTHATLDAIPATVAVGQLLRLNANANVACGSPIYHAGRVVAISNRAIVVADTANPAGGYTDAEYASFGTTFDTLIDPLDRQAFGDPSDIDGNGRVVVFFTKTVNDLTPATSASYIGGFFFARDLFPAQSTTEYDGCVGSNVGEMFYVMVPDPTRGGAFAKANVGSEVYGTLVHEYQHLINASRRMYVNTSAAAFEESWLDEGLAHMAEELLFYRVAGLQPRQDIDPVAIRASETVRSAFNDYASANFGRYEQYLLAPSAYSPYADNDSLATRGASWAFLRYAADHKASSDGTIWHDLVNSTTTGLANLQNVFGSGIMGELRNWGVSDLTDDLAGVDAAYQQPSWNFRAMFAALENTGVFPIADVSLVPGTHHVTLVRGANAYLRFTVPAGGSASLQWPTAPSTVQFSLVRTK
ncbi:MAG: hypothetical protein ABI205_08915, partial [Gemmatimonadaceae bacterium]